LSTVNIDMAEKLSGRCDAGKIMDGLVRENSFTYRISRTPDIYRFHPLFRRFLQSNAKQVMDSQQLTAKQEQAANLLVKGGQIEPAAELMIDAQAWPLLIELITSQADILLRQFRSQTLLQWLDALPAPLREKVPWLRYWRGKCILAMNPSDALQELSKAFELFEQEGNATGSMLSWSMVVNAIVIVWNDYTVLDEWIEHFDRLLERYNEYPSLEIESLMVQGICKSLAWRYPDRPDLPDWGARLYQLVTSSGDSNYRLLAGSNLALYHLISGDIAKAQSLTEILNNDLHSAEISPLKKLIWLATRGGIEWVLMDREACMATMEAGRTLIEESGVHVLSVRIYAQGITLGLTSGDLPLAEKLFEALLSTPIITAFDHCYHCLLLADYSLLKGDTAKAVVLAETAVKRADEGSNAVIKGLSLPVLILALHQDGQHERATRMLAESFDICKGMNFFQSFLHLLAAYFALQNGETKQARVLLRKGFGLAARQGYLNFLPWRNEIMSRLCGEALSTDIETEYVTRLAARHDLDITQSAPQPLTPKEIETLNWVQKGKTTWEIAKILGISKATVKFHIGNILRKLGAASRSQAVAIALKAGLLDKKE
jgi:ATP/maltotriose-dependent transcriptional regulator MalT